MKLYESQKPWKVETEGLKIRCKQLSDELSRYRISLERCQDVSGSLAWLCKSEKQILSFSVDVFKR
jgi:hypothetical protein